MDAKPLAEDSLTPKRECPIWFNSPVPTSTAYNSWELIAYRRPRCQARSSALASLCCPKFNAPTRSLLTVHDTWF